MEHINLGKYTNEMVFVAKFFIKKKTQKFMDIYEKNSN